MPVTLCRGLPVCLCKRLKKLGIQWCREILADGYDGWYDQTTNIIYTDERLSQARTRSVLAHEIVHAMRGDTHTRSAWRELKQERAVDIIAARILLPLDVLAEALMGAGDEFEVAEKLVVDVETVRARLSDLTPLETEYIDLRVDRILTEMVG